MNTKYVKKIKWFWAWNDDKEEAWLSEMSREGLHLKQISFITYTFEQGKPEHYVYRLDYRTLKSKDKESYLQLFKDAGWEHVGDMSGWVYFRTKADPGDAPDIFSDAESKTGKYQRIIIYLVILLPIMVILRPSTAGQYGTFSSIVEALYAVLFLLYAFSMVQLMRRMNEVKQKKGE